MKYPASIPRLWLRLLWPAWLAALVCMAWLTAPQARAGEPVPVLIGSPGLPRIDAATAARLYTGRTIAVAGQPVTVVHAPVGAPLRQRFLALVLQQDDEQYRAYWTVRRHVGKGAPPRELASSADVIQFVGSTPGAIGYIDATELRGGMNVLLRP